MITYSINNESFLDFKTICVMFPYSRSHTHKVLIDNDVPYLSYQNRKLYNKREVTELWRDEEAKKMINEKQPTQLIIELLSKKISNKNEKVH